MAVSADQLLAALQQQFPDYWAWLQGKPSALRKVQNLAAQYAAQATGSGARVTNQFLQTVQGLRSFATWSGGGDTDEPAPSEEPPEEEPELPGFPDFEPPTTSPEALGADVRGLLMQFLQENGLPTSLMSFIEQAIAQSKPYSQIIVELRQTPEYLAAYPENAMRMERGFDWIPEAQIRAYRSEARRIAEAYLGITITNQEIAQLLGNDKSLAEWERMLQTWQDFERWGPTVRAVFEAELGYVLPDDRVYAFLAPFIPTPELDRAYEMSLLRARPAVLGLGVRPDEEAEILRRYGISVEQAFRGYQGIVAELPRAERLAAIEAEINRNVERFPSGTELFADTPFATLFRAIQLGDPEAIATLQAQLAREVARFQAGGAPAALGTGLLSPEERAAI